MLEKQMFPFAHFSLKKTEVTAKFCISGENLTNFE